MNSRIELDYRNRGIDLTRFVCSFHFSFSGGRLVESDMKGGTQKGIERDGKCATYYKRMRQLFSSELGQVCSRLREMPPIKNA